MRKPADALRRYRDDAWARACARRRLPLWLRLLMPFLVISLLAGTIYLVFAAIFAVHDRFHAPMPWEAVPGPAKFLILAAAIGGGAVPALMLANLVLWSIPPVRHILDRNAEGVRGLGFRENMLSFARFSAIALPIAFVLALLGALDPWLG